MMKRRELLQRISRHAKQQGLLMEITEGASHTKVRVGDRVTVVPRHAEINEVTARAVLKQIGVLL